jgi:hypothetical protein
MSSISAHTLSRRGDGFVFGGPVGDHEGASRGQRNQPWPCVIAPAGPRGVAIRSMHDSGLKKLPEYGWLGNMREPRNVAGLALIPSRAQKIDSEHSGCPE